MPRFQNIERVARYGLLQLHAATDLASLRTSPGNRLETPKGNRKGQRSIRINDPRRQCFVWQEDGVQQVEIVDYHQGQDMAELLDEIHPGEILLEEFMKPMGITARRIAADIDVLACRISELISGAKRPHNRCRIVPRGPC